MPMPTTAPICISSMAAHLCIITMVINMQVKLFDEEDEMDLEIDINEFLSNDKIDVIDIKYQVGVSIYSEEQIYCFSAMIIYRIFE